MVAISNESAGLAGCVMVYDDLGDHGRQVPPFRQQAAGVSVGKLEKFCFRLDQQTILFSGQADGSIIIIGGVHHGYDFADIMEQGRRQTILQFYRDGYVGR